jgi:type II secretory pathway component PulM
MATGKIEHSKKKERQPSFIKVALEKLSFRERIMIGTLIVLALIAAVAFIVVLPALDRINGIEAEIVELEQQRGEVREEPDLRPEYQAAYEAALRDFENYQHFYYPFMDPETIDKTITNMLLESGLDPVRLTMSPLGFEPLTGYSASQTLVARPVPTLDKDTDDEGDNNKNENGEGGGTEGGGENTEGSEGDNGTNAENSENSTNTDDNADGDESPTEGTSRADRLASEAEAAGGNTSGEAGEIPAGTLVFCYTVDVESRGWMNDLFAFLESARGVTAMEVVSYSYVEPQKESGTTNETSSTTSSTTSTNATSNTNARAEPEEATIVMQVKFYVFINDSMTPTDALTNEAAS